MCEKKFFYSQEYSLTIVALTIVGARAAYNDHQSFFKQFRSFTIVIDNQADFDLVAVEAGILQSGANGNPVESGSKAEAGESLPSGDKLRFKPELSLTGEGSVYLKVTDSRGETNTHIVCSYTEYLSGQTDVTVSNDKVKIEQDCH